jgi:hypothetical protein
MGQMLQAAREALQESQRVAEDRQVVKLLVYQAFSY